MYGLKEMLRKEQEYLRGLSNTLREMNRSYPEGSLRTSGRNKHFQYYRFIPGETGDHGQYIHKKDEEIAKALAQKDYDEKLSRLLKRRLRQLEKLVSEYADNEIEQLYLKQSEARKRLVTPIEQGFEEMRAMWDAQEYDEKGFRENDPVIYTEKGERVRSKSEKILADCFYKNGIIYKYEKPLYLNGYGTVYPDFTFLSSKTKQEIYWEHEGRMDDPVYARSAVKKINLYESNRIYVGERLILTYETEDSVINTRDVMCKLERYLL